MPNTIQEISYVVYQKFINCIKTIYYNHLQPKYITDLLVTFLLPLQRIITGDVPVDKLI